MIQVNGTIRVADDASEDGIAAIITMMEKSRAETGCIDYTFARDLTDPQVLVLFERWRDAAALAAHGQSEHMRAFQQVMAANPPLARDIRLYETDDGRSL